MCQTNYWYSGVTEEKVEFHCSAEKGCVWKESGVITHGRRELEVGTLFLSNDKNNVIAKNVLSYFLCFSSKFEVQVTRFWTKQ